MTYVVNLKKAHLVLNIINNKKTIILICPGGGYELLSNRESGPISVKFNNLGYNTAILYYRLLPFENGEVAAAFIDGYQALEYLKEHFGNIVVMGFSAGGHLAGLLGTKCYQYNVKAMVLCYPVVTLTNPYTHKQTACNFLNNNLSFELIKEYSVENCINEHTVPCFVWTTKDDELVPVENTYLLKDSLDKYNIYNECVIYPHGPHGYALADESACINGDPYFLNKDVAKWPLLVCDFLNKILNK